MDSLKKIATGFFYGMWDSIKGMTLIFYIDAEIHRQNAEKEAERQQRLTEKQRQIQRTPSPTPSSASAMLEEDFQFQRAAMQKQNPDERSIDSIRKKRKPTVASIPDKERKIAKQILTCCAFNGSCTWMSIILFNQILLPALKVFLTICHGDNSEDLNMIWEWLQPILSMMFEMMWVLPIFFISKLVSSLWFADIAYEAYKVRRGKPNIRSFSKFIADFLFSIMVQALFLVQSMLVNMLPFPYIGATLCFMHMCLLYSLYAFEYKWFNMGWELHIRLNYLENNWPYFMGFGLPLTLLTNMSSSTIISGSIFSIFFPLFILSGNEAKPIVGTTDTPLRLFSPTIFVSNLMFGGGKPSMTANKNAQLKHQQQYNHHQQLLLKQERQQRSHSSAMENTPTPSQASQFRYPQPPQRISPARSTPERQLRSEFSRTQIRYNEGTRTLIPTPVPGAPGLRSNINLQVKSTTQRR